MAVATLPHTGGQRPARSPRELDRAGDERACRIAFDLEAYRKPFELEDAAALLKALGVPGVTDIRQCWVECGSGEPKRQAVLAGTRETWPGTRLPVERVFYLRSGGGHWVLEKSCRVLPNEWFELEEAEARIQEKRRQACRQAIREAANAGDLAGLAGLIAKALAAV